MKLTRAEGEYQEFLEPYFNTGHWYNSLLLQRFLIFSCTITLSLVVGPLLIHCFIILHQRNCFLDYHVWLRLLPFYHPTEIFTVKLIALYSLSPPVDCQLLKGLLDLVHHCTPISHDSVQSLGKCFKPAH